jgi:rRNA maturation RNase YbeY
LIDEMARLVVHGVLHILGWDHDTAEKTQVMQERERALLQKYHWHGEAPVAFRQEVTS